MPQRDWMGQGLEDLQVKKLLVTATRGIPVSFRSRSQVSTILREITKEAWRTFSRSWR